MLDFYTKTNTSVPSTNPTACWCTAPSSLRTHPNLRSNCCATNWACAYIGHRLDRKTGGVLVFGLVKEMDSALQKLFMEQHVEKTYLALVRGYTDDTGTVDYPLRKENGTLQEAVTHYQTLSRTEIDLPTEQHPTSRYSLVRVRPETGRMHQIRKHFKHIFPPHYRRQAPRLQQTEPPFCGKIQSCTRCCCMPRSCRSSTR